MLRLPLDEASAKVRTGGPIDDDDDLALPVWAGVVPLRLVAGDPVADAGIPAPWPGYDLDRSAEPGTELERRELAVLAAEELQRPDVVPFDAIASTWPITHQWSPASATESMVQSIHDSTPSMIGEPGGLGAVRQRVELGALLRAEGPARRAGRRRGCSRRTTRWPRSAASWWSPCRAGTRRGVGRATPR